MGIQLKSCSLIVAGELQKRFVMSTSTTSVVPIPAVIAQAVNVGNPIGKLLDGFQSTVDGIVNNAANQAANVATRALITAGNQTSVVITQVSNEYKERLTDTAEAINVTAVKVFADLENMVNGLAKTTDETLQKTLDDAEAIVRLLPFTGTQIFVSGYSDHFFALDADQISLKFKGNFPYSSSYSFTATLAFNGVKLTPFNASDKEIEFRINPSVIFKQTLVPQQLALPSTASAKSAVDEKFIEAFRKGTLLQEFPEEKFTQGKTRTVIGSVQSKMTFHQGELEISYRPHIYNWTSTVKYPVGLTQLPDSAGQLAVHYKSTALVRDVLPVTHTGLYYDAPKGSGTVVKTDVIVPTLPGYTLVTADPGRPVFQTAWTKGSVTAEVTALPTQATLFITLFAAKKDASVIGNFLALQERHRKSGEPFVSEQKEVDWDAPMAIELPNDAEYAKIVYESSDGGRREYVTPFKSDAYLQFTQGANGSWSVIADPARNPAV